ncbi:MAG: hypothetical protein ABH816_03695 [Candidatus Levyibacteriota bacterium]
MRNFQNGQTLIEALVAMAAAVAVISAITAAVIASLNNAQYSKNQSLAAQYAQEGMELLRGINKSSDWATLILSKHYCLGEDMRVASSCQQNIGIYIREVDLDRGVSPDGPSPCVNNQTKATVTVSWSDAKCVQRPGFCNSVKISSCFSNFNTVANP